MSHPTRMAVIGAAVIGSSQIDHLQRKLALERAGIAGQADLSQGGTCTLAS